ncbi:stage II sporulation protein M [Glaciibacter flavus]|uniref:Stage II sporulation protein M n=1 Tax=Orlajensenia flava TaxID=2565934 RepID=A0A4S4G025_9MICO|nr:stage II sporulation protein M [Glaciibacter flavus]THG35705.1 stage II sporulation protein M [Glaciibacter flavus]
MDLDAYTAAHNPDWERLDALSSRRSLSGAEADELITAYQGGATGLSAIKTTAGSTVQGDRLSVSLSRARGRFTAPSANLFSLVPRFFVLQLPAALWRLRWLTLAVAVVTVIIAALYAWWALGDPQVLASFGTEEQRRALVDEKFVGYYSENPAASFAGAVWTNNAWVAAQCIALGITGFFVPYVIIGNAMNIGVSAGIMFAYGRGDVFFQYILPHGLLELSCVFVAAAAGLRIFWAWIAPGARTRGQALAEDARALFIVAIGLAIALFVSGIIEGFVTPSPLPWPVKLAIGVVAAGLFYTYMLVVGRRAARAGETGDMGEFEAGARQLIAG